MTEQNEFLVSIRLNSYNQEKYIAAAMDSIMMQKVDFPVEVVVGDDLSTDRTLEIIRTYKDTEFIKIKILERVVGDAYSIERKEKGRLFNYLNTLRNCTGKYVAMLDGDDYWTDCNKLSAQVKFLESNPDYSMCSHEVFKINPFERKSLSSAVKIFVGIYKFGDIKEFFNALKLSVTFSDKFWLMKPDHPKIPRSNILTFEEMLFRKLFQQTSAIMFRRSIVDLIPDWFTKINHSHYAIILYSLIEGKNFHFNKYFGVHRLGESSLSRNSDFHSAGRRTYKTDFLLLLNHMKELVNGSKKKAIEKRLVQVNAI